MALAGFLGACAAVTLVPIVPASVSAQPDINEAVTIEDLGLMHRLHVGARPAAMAGTYTSFGGDSHSLVYNPAGLSGVKRIDFGIGFQHQSNTIKSTFYGAETNVDVTASTLDFLSIAYPVPTYRGSLVLAAGVYRNWSSQFDLVNRGTNVSTQTFDDYRLQQSGSVYSYNFGLGIDLSPQVSAGFNLFFMDATIKALTQFEYEFLTPGAADEVQSEQLTDDAKVDLDGYGATFGVQWHPLRVFHFGVAVTTPIPVNLRGDAYQEVATYYGDSSGDLTSGSFLIDVDYRLPLRVDVGGSFGTKYVTLAADLTYQDWGQTELQNVQLKDENLTSIFNQVVEARLGAEAGIPLTSIRFRAGYAYLPYGLEYLQADRITGDALTKAAVKTDQQLVSVGGGILVGKVLALDVAAELMIGERTIPTLVDERERWRVLLSGAYRF